MTLIIEVELPNGNIATEIRYHVTSISSQGMLITLYRDGVAYCSYPKRIIVSIKIAVNSL